MPPQPTSPYLIPLDADPSSISAEERDRLIARIDRRRDRWKRLRELLS